VEQTRTHSPFLFETSIVPCYKKTLFFLPLKIEPQSNEKRNSSPEKKSKISGKCFCSKINDLLAKLEIIRIYFFQVDWIFYNIIDFGKNKNKNKDLSGSQKFMQKIQ
jgi:hypothetical protein